MDLKGIASKAHSYCSSHSLYFIKPLQHTASRWGTRKHYYSQYWVYSTSVEQPLTHPKAPTPNPRQSWLPTRKERLHSILTNCRRGFCFIFFQNQARSKQAFTAHQKTVNLLITPETSVLYQQPSAPPAAPAGGRLGSSSWWASRKIMWPAPRSWAAKVCGGIKWAQPHSNLFSWHSWSCPERCQKPREN